MSLFLLIVGILLLIVEAFLPMFGLIGLFGLTLIITAGFIAFNVSWGIGAVLGLSFVLAALIGGACFFVVKRYRDKNGAGNAQLIGKTAKVVEWEGKQGRVEVEDRTYHAFSHEHGVFDPADYVQVIGTEDLSLKIQAIKKA